MFSVQEKRRLRQIGVETELVRLQDKRQRSSHLDRYHLRSNVESTFSAIKRKFISAPCFSLLVPASSSLPR